MEVMDLWSSLVTLGSDVGSVDAGALFRVASRVQSMQSDGEGRPRRGTGPAPGRLRRRTARQ